MSTGIARLFALVVLLVGAAPKGTPAELQLKTGQTVVAIGDSITAAGGYLRMSDREFGQCPGSGIRLFDLTCATTLECS